MKWPWGTPCLLLCLPSLCIGQSLGAAAQKEHERREKARESGAPSRTVTDADLASTRPTASEPEASPEPAEDAEDQEASGHEPPTPIGFRLPEGPDTTPAANNEGYWRGRVAAALGRLQEAQRRYDSLQRQIRIGQPTRYNASGQRVIYSIYQMKEKADAAEAELRVAEKALEDLYTEARRAGALPGWLR